MRKYIFVDGLLKDLSKVWVTSSFPSRHFKIFHPYPLLSLTFSHHYFLSTLSPHLLSHLTGRDGRWAARGRQQAEGAIGDSGWLGGWRIRLHRACDGLIRHRRVRDSLIRRCAPQRPDPRVASRSAFVGLATGIGRRARADSEWLAAATDHAAGRWAPLKFGSGAHPDLAVARVIFCDFFYFLFFALKPYKHPHAKIRFCPHTWKNSELCRPFKADGPEFRTRKSLLGCMEKIVVVLVIIHGIKLGKSIHLSRWRLFRRCARCALAYPRNLKKKKRTASYSLALWPKFSISSVP